MSNKTEKTDEEWRSQLTEEQYRVTRKAGTERPFTGEYDDFFERGSYACVCCGHELFDSDSKFHSGCGYASLSSIFPVFFVCRSVRPCRILASQPIMRCRLLVFRRFSA